MCSDDLTARVFIQGGYTDGKTGNNVYVARVQQVYMGKAARRYISIEAPASCGFEFHRGSYVVSLNAGERADYTSFACSSFVAPYASLDSEQRRVLSNPFCPPTCDDVTCDEGSTCELQEVQCIRAPCPPVPVCVPSYPTCANVRCGGGQVCEMQEVQCIRAPCPPVPVCVDAQDTCHDYSGQDLGMCKVGLGWAVRDGECSYFGGCISERSFYPSREACQASCAVSENGMCYQFQEADPAAFVNRPCQDGLTCQSDSGYMGFNSVKYCR